MMMNFKKLWILQWSQSILLILSCRNNNGPTGSSFLLLVECYVVQKKKKGGNDDTKWENDIVVMMQQRKSQKRSKNPRFFSRHLIFAGSIIHHPMQTNWKREEVWSSSWLRSYASTKKLNGAKMRALQQQQQQQAKNNNPESSLAPDIYVSTFVPTYTMYQYELPVSIFNSDLHLDHLYSSVTTHS